MITSENYPDNYPDDFNRNYTINAEDTILITFLDFDLEVWTSLKKKLFFNFLYSGPPLLFLWLGDDCWWRRINPPWQDMWLWYSCTCQDPHKYSCHRHPFWWECKLQRIQHHLGIKEIRWLFHDIDCNSNLNFFVRLQMWPS